MVNSWLILTKPRRGKCAIKQQIIKTQLKIKGNQQQCDRGDTNKEETITAGSVKRESKEMENAKLKVEGGRKKGIMAETA